MEVLEEGNIVDYSEMEDKKFECAEGSTLFKVEEEGGDVKLVVIKKTVLDKDVA